VLCGELAVPVRVAPDRLPPNNLAGNLDFAGGRIQDRVTSHTSRKIAASQFFRICDAGPCLFLQEPAPRSQGCEVARVLPALDTAPQDKFPPRGVSKSLPGCKDFSGNALSFTSVNSYVLDSMWVRAGQARAIFW